MADDTRQPSTDNATPPPRPKAPANVMPGGDAHTAGGKVDGNGPTYFDVVKSLGPEYYLNFYKRPCVRDGQLTGLGAAFTAGGLAAILRYPVLKCCNVAVLSWAGVSCAAYQYCQYWRSKEKDGIKQMKELMEAKQANIAAKKEARRKARDEQERLEEERRREEERRKTWGYWFNKNVRFW